MQQFPRTSLERVAPAPLEQGEHAVLHLCALVIELLLGRRQRQALGGPGLGRRQNVVGLLDGLGPRGDQGQVHTANDDNRLRGG